jgi:5-methylcytosine-specific restriction endonuclease McrA
MALATVVKMCSMCKETLTVEHFHLNRSRKDGRADACKACFKTVSRKHYENNKGAYLERNNRTRKKNREMVKQLKSRPCMDCGNTFPTYVMEFDHRDPVSKDFSIGRGNFSWLKKMLSEIEKCDIVCSNCHKVRTFTRRTTVNLTGDSV